MFCKNCGKGLEAGSHFCQSCGANQDSSPTFNTPSSSSGNAYSTTAIVLAVIALWVFPIVFGPIAIVLASVGKSKGEPRAQNALIWAVVGTIAGMIFGYIAWGGY